MSGNKSEDDTVISIVINEPQRMKKTSTWQNQNK